MRLYGHHALALSDFGNWSCRACEKHGSDYSHPEDHSCEFIGDYAVIKTDWTSAPPTGKHLIDGDLMECAKYLQEHPELEGGNVEIIRNPVTVG